MQVAPHRQRQREARLEGDERKHQPLGIDAEALAPRRGCTPSSAAAWSTFICAQCHLLYGKANGRFVALGSRMNAASRGSGNAAWGTCAATALNPAHRRAISSRCSSSERPSAWRSALSMSAKGSIADDTPPSISMLVMISSVGSCRSSGAAPSCTVSTKVTPCAAGERRAPRRFPADDQRHVQHPGTDRRVRVVRTASAAECPWPTSTVCAPAAPIRSAMMRPGSVYFQ